MRRFKKLISFKLFGVSFDLSVSSFPRGYKKSKRDSIQEVLSIPPAISRATNEEEKEMGDELRRYNDVYDNKDIEKSTSGLEGMVQGKETEQRRVNGSVD